MASAGGQPNSIQSYAWHDEFYIGPPSQAVDIASFLSAALNASHKDLDEQAGAVEAQEGLAKACSVDNLKEELDQLLAIPEVFSYIKRRHTLAAQRVFELAQGNTDEPDAWKARGKSLKRQRSEEGEDTENAVLSPRATDVLPEAAYARDELEGLNLHMNASLSPQAQFFIRRPRITDQNSLQSVMDRTMQPIGLPDEREIDDDSDEPDVVLSISVYTAHSVWPNGLRVSSKHDLLASNTLADLMRAIPCQSAAIPHASKRIYPDIDQLDRACIGMEDVVYGHHPQDQEGISKLLSYLNTKKPSGLSLRPSAVELENVRLGSLSLRMNYPYWIFHAGMCEHIWTIDGVHLHDKSDPDQGTYPLTTFLPGSNAPNCGVCKTLPAVITVSGDIRLGESPCLVCKSCWEILGWPRGGEEIEVMRLIGPRTPIVTSDHD